MALIVGVVIPTDYQLKQQKKKKGKWLDVPGWMAGDDAAVRLRHRAATIIRERLARGKTPLGV